MAEKGLVTELKGENAVVVMVRTEACAKCRACISGMSEKEMIIEAENVCGANVDDWVELELQENGFYNAVLIMYGIPLLAFLAGLLLGYFVIIPYFAGGDAKDILSFGLGLFFTFLAFLWIKLNENKWEAKKYRPIIARITEPDTGKCH